MPDCTAIKDTLYDICETVIFNTFHFEHALSLVKEKIENTPFPPFSFLSLSFQVYKIYDLRRLVVCKCRLWNAYAIIATGKILATLTSMTLRFSN